MIARAAASTVFRVRSPGATRCAPHPRLSQVGLSACQSAKTKWPAKTPGAEGWRQLARTEGLCQPAKAEGSLTLQGRRFANTSGPKARNMIARAGASTASGGPGRAEARVNHPINHSSPERAPQPCRRFASHPRLRRAAFPVALGSGLSRKTSLATIKTA
jgi:hypothetical protein